MVEAVGRVLHGVNFWVSGVLALLWVVWVWVGVVVVVWRLLPP